MENNFKYFNAFFIIIILIMLIGLFKYFFYNNQEKTNFNNNQKKYLNKNYIDHILFIPDNYYFVRTKKIDNIHNEYNLLLKKIFSIITEALKYNINTISVNLISFTDLLLIDSIEIKELINNKELWKFIEKTAKKINVKINFIYNKTLIDPNLIKIFKKIENNTNNAKYNSEVNFIVGYDLFSDIKNNLIHLVETSKDKNDLLTILKTIEIENFLLHKIPPINLSIIFNNASMNDSLLLHMKNCKIIHLNYSLEKITKKIMHLLLKELLINVHPFF